MNNSPILISKNNELANIPITGNQFTIGRGIQNSYVFKKSKEGSLTVSRVQCKFECKDGDWYIQDLSTNGTWVDGQLLGKSNECKLSHGSQILFGITYLYKFICNEATEKMAARVPCEESNSSNSVNVQTVQDQIDVSAGDSVSIATVEEKIPAVGSTSDSVLPSEAVVTSEDSATDPKTSSLPPKSEILETNCSTSATSDSNSAKKANLNDKVEEEMRCSICTELFIKATTLNCAHTFCSYCILEWRNKNNRCPICRLDIKSVAPTLVLDNIINNMVELLTPEERDQRKAVLEERETKTKELSSSSKGLTGKRKRDHLIDLTEDSDFSETNSDSDEDFEETSSDFELFEALEAAFDRPPIRSRGYGYCYVCGDPGHWAPDCPRRSRTRR